VSDISIRLATKDDTEAVVTMLTQLASDLGSEDHFLSTREAIAEYGFGTRPMFECFVAERENSNLGLALFFPIFSTNRAKPGVYVQDLWISGDARGQGLGRRMLAEVVNYGAQNWDATYLSLMVYADNIKAREFYRKLGFDKCENDVSKALDGDAFARLKSAL